MIWVKNLIKIVYLKTAFYEVFETRKRAKLVFEKRVLVSEKSSKAIVHMVLLENLSVQTPFDRKVSAGSQAFGSLSGRFDGCFESLFVEKALVEIGFAEIQLVDIPSTAYPIDTLPALHQTF